MLELKSEREYDKFFEDNSKIILDIYTPACGPCKLIAPKIEVLSHDPKYTKISFAKINAVGNDNDFILAGEKHVKNVSSVPTFITFHDGKEVDRYTGSNIDEVVKLVDKLNKI